MGVRGALADRLGYRYIDTGALYRGIAHEAQKSGIEPDDDDAVEQLLAIIGRYYASSS